MQSVVDMYAADPITSFSGYRPLFCHMKFKFTLLALGLFCALTVFKGVPARAEDDIAAVRDEIKALENRHAAEISTLQARLRALEDAGRTNTAPDTAPVQPPVDPLSGFSFTGYLRSGFGINSHGGHQTAFQAPGADAKYRLGNEAETYLETAFTQRINTPDTQPFFIVQVRLSYKTDQDTAASIHDDGLALREGYVQAGGFEWAPEVKFWAGQRFYRRLDIHINDFYVLDMSGYGGGIEDIPLPMGDLKLAAAYLGGSSDDYQFPKTGRIAKNSLDLRIYDIPCPLGVGTIWIAPASVKGGDYEITIADGQTVTQVYESSVGYAAGFIHDMPLPNKNANRFTVQYGHGAGADFAPVVQKPTAGLDDAWRFRMTDSALIQTGDRLSLLTALIWQVFDNGEEQNSKINWLSAGLRPIYNFNRHLALAVETGADWVDNQPEDCRGVLCKFTVAPELRIGPAFFDRPVLRAYCTYAVWSDEFKGKIGESAYLDQTAGLSFGLQCEAWW